MWIMVAGPYRSGSAAPDVWAANLRVLNQAAVDLFRAGHVPVIGVNMALPMIEAAGPESFDSIMMPVSLALADRCDACLRIGGASEGADRMVSTAQRLGKRVFRDLSDVPPAMSAGH